MAEVKEGYAGLVTSIAGKINALEAPKRRARQQQGVVARIGQRNRQPSLVLRAARLIRVGADIHNFRVRGGRGLFLGFVFSVAYTQTGN